MSDKSKVSVGGTLLAMFLMKAGCEGIPRIPSLLDNLFSRAPSVATHLPTLLTPESRIDDLAREVVDASTLALLRSKELLLEIPLSADPQTLFAHEVTSPTLITLLPQDESQFRHMYRRPRSAADESRMTRLTNDLAGQTDTDAVTTWNELLNVLDAADDGTVPTVILAHSEDNGRTVVMPRGNRVPVESVHQACVERERLCIVLTCHSYDLQLDTEIAPEEALKMWRTAADFSKSRNAVTVDQFALVMRLDLRSRRAARQIAVSTVALSAGGGLVVSLRSRRE